MNFYWDRQGRPLTDAAWIKLFSDPHYKQVACTVIGPITVSTVWLGMGSVWSAKVGRAPRIFETMLFGPSFRGRNNQWRWSTEAEAQTGHQHLVAQLRLQSRPRGPRPLGRYRGGVSRRQWRAAREVAKELGGDTSLRADALTRTLG